MPALSPDRLRQIDALFEEALTRPPEERAAFLAKACGDDTPLAREVEALLASDEQAAQLLGDSVTDFAAPLLPDLQATLTAASEHAEADTVGPYRLLHPLGEGGMGRVYLAERDDGHFHHHVALKLVKRGMDTDEILRRFRHERQILASLQHPNIAHLFDGGMSHDGRPYLVMEYVDGIPIDQYCDERRLSVEQRLRLFDTVCQAVQYAHQNLVVHRDLKPSNILVTAAGEVKLLDFGIAKLLDEERSAVSVPVTRTGVRVMTPEYAAPEQVEGAPITTATDVHALGIVLYELLTGRRPFARTGTALRDAEHALPAREPVRPSTAVTKTIERRRHDGTTETIAPDAVSLSRSTSTERLHRRLRGDLDTILLKALQHEPARRYASAEAFVEDIKRHLAGLPVQARPDTAGYRLRTFVRRNAPAVTAAVVVALLLIGFAVAMAVQTQRVAAERDVAAQERDKAQQVATFLEGLFAAADPAAAERLDTLRVREVLNQGAARVQTDLADQPLLQAQMQHVIGRTFKRLGLYAAADTLLHQALGTRRTAHGSAHPDVAETLLEVGSVRRTYDDYEAAEQAVREALAIYQQHFGDAHPQTAHALVELAITLGDLGNFEEAERLFRQALAVQKQAYGAQSPAVAGTTYLLAKGLFEQGRLDEAEAGFRDAISLYGTLYGADHPKRLSALYWLAFLQFNQGRYREAETHIREAITIEETLELDRYVLREYLTLLSSSLRKQARYDEAEAALRKALTKPIRRPSDQAKTLGALATLQWERGDLVQAEATQREVLTIGRVTWGDRDPVVAFGVVKLAGILRDQQRFAEAEALLLDSHRLLSRRADEHNMGSDYARQALVELYEAWGKPEQAAAYRPASDGT